MEFQFFLSAHCATMVYICTKFHEMEFQFFLSAHCLKMVYICTKFHENILNGISYGADMTITSLRWVYKKRLLLKNLLSTVPFHN